MDPERLSGLSLYADLDDGARTEVAACTREVTIEAGATVATQGDNAFEFFVIEAGEAEVRRDGEVIATVGPGEVVGEIGLLMTGTRTASIVATSDMTLMAMFSREFRQLARTHPEIADRVRATMRERLARTGYRSRG